MFRIEVPELCAVLGYALNLRTLTPTCVVLGSLPDLCQLAFHLGPRSYNRVISCKKLAKSLVIALFAARRLPPERSGVIGLLGTG